MSRNNNGKGFVFGAALGAALGVLGGILLAPKKGEETRNELKEKIDKISEKAAEAVKEINEKGKNLAEEAKGLGGSVKKVADGKIQKLTDQGSKQSAAEEKVEDKPKAKKRYFKGV